MDCFSRLPLAPFHLQTLVYNKTPVLGLEDRPSRIHYCVIDAYFLPVCSVLFIDSDWPTLLPVPCLLAIQAHSTHFATAMQTYSSSNTGPQFLMVLQWTTPNCTFTCALQLKLHSTQAFMNPIKAGLFVCTAPVQMLSRNTESRISSKRSGLPLHARGDALHHISRLVAGSDSCTVVPTAQPRWRKF